MKNNFSKKVTDLLQSEIRNMSLECDKVGGINLSQGMCDLPLPTLLKDAVNEAIDLGYNHYTRYDGIDYLRHQIAIKAHDFNGIDCNENINITVSAGATGALYCACYALFNPGDEVIIFEPFYGYHEYTLTSLGLVPKYMRLEDGTWEIDYDVLESLISSHTRAILISNPINPCGKVFTREELLKLGLICLKHNMFLISDEIYEYIVFDGKKHISPASISEIKSNVITISGYSKTYSITGWRIGYSIAEKGIATMIGAVNDMLYVCAPAPLQYAVAKGIEFLPKTFYENNCKDYQEKRDMLCECLLHCGLRPYSPEGAYYVLADVSILPGKSSKQKAMYLLSNSGIGVVPGEAFYKKGGENTVRFCFAKDKCVIEEACILLEKNCNQWL